MNHEDYTKIEAMNWSTLKAIQVSPAYFRHLADHPEEAKAETDALRIGTHIHCAICEPEKLSSNFIVKPDFAQMARDKYGSLRTNEAKIYRDGSDQEWEKNAPPNAKRISSTDLEIALRCADAVHRHPVAMEYLEGASFEQVLEWTDRDTGVKCKGRADAVTNRIIDLKSTRHATVHEIIRAAASYGYHCQAAFYHDGGKACGLTDGVHKPAMIAIHYTQSSKFVDVAVFDMSAYGDVLEAGRAEYKRLLALYAGCKAADNWPGMAPEYQPWTLPGWMMKEIQND